MFKLSNLFGGKDKKSVNKTKPSVVKPLPDSILSLINDAGRVDIAVLKKLAKQHSAEQFEAFLAVPVIAGKGTIAGDIKLKEDHVEHATKMFKPADMQKEIMNETIQNAIFPLIKKLYSNQSGLLYTIGRSMDNELVIPDHAMSKVHAKISFRNGKYWIVDCGSTNGTTVNDEPVAEEEVMIQDKDHIGFGRYEFNLLYPNTFCQKLKQLVS